MISIPRGCFSSTAELAKDFFLIRFFKNPHTFSMGLRSDEQLDHFLNPILLLPLSAQQRCVPGIIIFLNKPAVALVSKHLAFRGKKGLLIDSGHQMSVQVLGEEEGLPNPFNEKQPSHMDLGSMLP